MDYRQLRLAGAMAVFAGLLAAGPAQAVTCQDAIDRFERRALTSSIAAEDPDRLQQLLNRTDEAAELRDDERCIRIVAELNRELPEEDRAVLQGQ